MTAVLGIDSSLTISGCALVQFGVWRAPVWETWRGRKVNDLGTVEGMRRRIRVMLSEILAPVPTRLDLSVIEGPSMRSKNPALADERAALRWMLIDQLMARGPVVVMAPKTRAILATDNGNADKPEVHAAMRREFPSALIPDHNVGDAVALAAAGAHALGMTRDLSKKQIKAHAKVAWPVETVSA